MIYENVMFLFYVWIHAHIQIEDVLSGIFSKFVSKLTMYDSIDYFA